MPSKLNWLLSNTSPGSIILQAWLTRHGIGPSLAQKYTRSEWLIKLRAGVYTRPGRSPGWPDALQALISQLALPVHLAGLTSLAWQGKAHYLPLRDERVWLLVERKDALPTWFREFDARWELRVRPKLESRRDGDLVDLEVRGAALVASAPELAALEMLDAVPRTLSFEHAAEVFQGLVNLRPRRVQSLLERSRSVQANRLYLFLAHHYAHPWVGRLNESVIPLGAGKRQVTKGGRLDGRYGITVPAQFIEVGETHG